MTYSSTTGTVGYAYIGDFSLETDSSIWPMEDTSE